MPLYCRKPMPSEATCPVMSTCIAELTDITLSFWAIMYGSLEYMKRRDSHCGLWSRKAFMRLLPMAKPKVVMPRSIFFRELSTAPHSIRSTIDSTKSSVWMPRWRFALHR